MATPNYYLEYDSNLRDLVKVPDENPTPYSYSLSGNTQPAQITNSWTMPNWLSNTGSYIKDMGTGLSRFIFGESPMSYEDFLVNRLNFASNQPLNSEQALLADKAYNNYLARMQAQNAERLAPLSLGLQGLGLAFNWWNAANQTNLAKKALNQQWNLAKANFNNSVTTLEDARRDRYSNRSAFSGDTYVAPTPLQRIA